MEVSTVKRALSAQRPGWIPQIVDLLPGMFVRTMDGSHLCSHHRLRKRWFGSGWLVRLELTEVTHKPHINLARHKPRHKVIVHLEDIVT
jgi:hypothetical protein